MNSIAKPITVVTAEAKIYLVSPKIKKTYKQKNLHSNLSDVSSYTMPRVSDRHKFMDEFSTTEAFARVTNLGEEVEALHQRYLTIAEYAERDYSDEEVIADVTKWQEIQTEIERKNLMSNNNRLVIERYPLGRTYTPSDCQFLNEVLPK